MTTDDMRELNNTNNTFDNGMHCTGSWPSTTVQLIIIFLILVCSLAGNVLIVAIFCRDKTLRTTVNYFIVNMCVSDLIFPTIILPIWITLTKYKNMLVFVEVPPAALCKIFLMALGVSVLVSVFSMTAIAADRFRAVIFPMKPALFSPKKCYVAITAMWISSFAVLVYHASTVSFHPDDSCTDSYTATTSNEMILFGTFFALMCLFAVFITVIYSKLAVFLYRQKNSLHLGSEVVKKRAKRNRKIISMLIIIVILFYILYINYIVVSFLFYRFHVSLPCIYVWFASVIFPIIFPVFNPVVYFVFNEKYRHGLWKILCCLPFVRFSRKLSPKCRVVKPNRGQNNE